MTVTSSEAFNAEQSQIYILPVSASTSDIQGINIKLINENLGDKIMFFSDFHTSQKMNKHFPDMHCRLM